MVLYLNINCHINFAFDTKPKIQTTPQHTDTQ